MSLLSEPLNNSRPSMDNGLRALSMLFISNNSLSIKLRVNNSNPSFHSHNKVNRP